MRHRAFRNLCTLMILAAPAAVAVAVAVAGEPTGVQLYSEARDAMLPAPVLGSFVHLEVTGIVARGKVTQIFHNPTGEWLSGIYLFPLPENAAIDALRMTVGGRVLEAGIAEREEAAARYQEARRTGVKASLLAQQRPDVFTLSVAEIGPGEEIEVEVELQFEVRYDDGRFRLRFPLLVAERYKARAVDGGPPAAPPLPVPPTRPAGDAESNPVALRVDLASGYPLAPVTSPSHAIRVVERPGFAYAVELASELVPAAGDFVLEWGPAPDDRARAAVAVEQDDGQYYALLSILPPAGLRGQRVPREAIFVIDTSGSMRGAALEQAKRALVLALDDLEPFDRFNVIRFSDLPERLFPAAMAADPAALEAARAWVLALRVNGGTRMLPALAAALEGGQVCGLLRQVVFVTDGQVENEMEFFTRLREQQGSSRLFTVGIGSAPNGYFIRRAAEIGRGTFTSISDPGEVEGRMSALLRKLTSPALTDLEVFWADPTAESWPRRPGDLYLGEPLVVAARLRRLGGDVRIVGRHGDQAWELTVPLAGAVPGVGIGKLWARRQIAAWSEPLVDGEVGGPEEIRRRIVELALAHRLVSRYTSLIALDDAPTGPGQAPERMLAVHAPRGQQPAITVTSALPVTPAPPGSFDPRGDVVEEIIVTSEVPLIDRTITCVVAAWSPDEVEMIPAFSEPWSLVARAPGIVADRELGNGAAAAPRFNGRGAASEQNVVRLDGFEITDDSSGESSFDLGQLRLAEVEVASGGCAGRLAAPGLRVDLRAREGTNAWRASGGGRVAAGSDGRDLVAGTPGGGPRGGSVAELEVGGPLRLDRLWLWGALSRVTSRRDAPGGQRMDADLEHAAGKLQGVLADTSLAASWHRGETREAGRGAGPGREPAATWDHDGGVRLLRLQASRVANPSLALASGYGELVRRFDDLPRGGLGGEAFVDPGGVAGGTTFARSGERDTAEWNLGASAYFSLGATHHELELGARRRRHAGADRWSAAGARQVEAGENLGSASGEHTPGDVLTEWLDSGGRSELERQAGWIQDELRTGRLTLVFGLRFDRQQGASRVRAAGGGVEGGDAEADWRSLSPRLGINWAPAASERTLLRAGYGRFASRLGPALSARLGEGVPIADVDLFADADGDLRLDPEESASRRPWVGVRPDRLAAELSPEITDQATLAIEHQFQPRFLIGLTLSHRRSHDLLERRELVRETGGAGSAAGWRPATASDWRPAESLSGSLPDGESYDVTAYDLLPGLELAPSGLWINGDRRRETLAASLVWRGRLGRRWRTGGHLTWSDARWRLGEEFSRFDDPTDAAGSGDDDGERVVEPGARGAAGGRWSFHAGASVELPWDLDLGLAVNGREGHALPYFRRVARARAGVAAVELTRSADSFRASDLVTFDLRLAKEISLGDLGLSLGLEAFNLLGADAVLRRELDLGVGRGGAADEVVTPRTLRLGVRLGWR